MRVTCSHCGAEVELSPNSGGAKQRCGFCGGTVALPPQLAQSAPSFFRVYRIPIVVFTVLVFVGSVGIFALFVPEMKFRRAMEQGRAAETAGQWKQAHDYYRLARDLRAGGAGVDDALKRVTAQMSQPIATVAPRNPPPMPHSPVSPPATQTVAAPAGVPLPSTRPVITDYTPTGYSLPAEPIFLTFKPIPNLAAIVALPVGTFATATQARQFILQHLASKLGADFSYLWTPPKDNSSDRWWASGMFNEINALSPKNPGAPSDELRKYIAQRFLIADYLLAHSELAAKRQGFGILLQLLRPAFEKLGDKPLATALADHVLANMDIADKRQEMACGLRHATESAVFLYRQMGDNARAKIGFVRLSEVGEFYGNENLRDSSRWHLARLYLADGDRENARKYAELIDAKGSIGGGRQEVLRELDGASQPRRRGAQR